MSDRKNRRSTVFSSPMLESRNEQLSVLILKAEWLAEILDKGKRMELRGSRSRKVGSQIGLMAAKTEHIAGMATIIDCVGPMSLQYFLDTRTQHHCNQQHLPYTNTYGWILDDVVKLDMPLPHKRKKGVVVFSKYHY